MDLDLVSNLSIKPVVSYGDHMYKHADEMADLDFVTVSATAVGSDHSQAIAGVKTIPVKKVPSSNSSLCRVCGSHAYVNGGFYSSVAGKLEKENISLRNAQLFGVEDDNVSVGPHILCKKCFRRIERYEATLGELSSFRETYKSNLVRWKNEAQSQRIKRCSSSP